MPLSELAPKTSPSLGDADAKVIIIEFADFACPACREIFKRLEHFHQVRTGFVLVFRHLPQPQIHGHEASVEGAKMSEIAQDKGLFWQFAARAYATPAHPSADDYRAVLNALKLDPSAATAADAARLEEDRALARKLDMGVTPTFIVLSPDQPVQVTTNVGLVELLANPKVAKYLLPRNATH
jgi:protein-disulfide isomerase